MRSKRQSYATPTLDADPLAEHVNPTAPRQVTAAVLTVRPEGNAYGGGRSPTAAALSSFAAALGGVRIEAECVRRLLEKRLGALVVIDCRWWIGNLLDELAVLAGHLPRPVARERPHPPRRIACSVVMAEEWCAGGCGDAVRSCGGARTRSRTPYDGGATTTWLCCSRRAATASGWTTVCRRQSRRCWIASRRGWSPSCWMRCMRCVPCPRRQSLEGARSRLSKCLTHGGTASSRPPMHPALMLTRTYVRTLLGFLSNSA
jgi:hypothetical protein